MEKIVATSEILLACLFYTRFLSAMYNNDYLRELLDDVKTTWRRAFFYSIPEWQAIFKETNEYVRGLSQRILNAVNFIGVYYTLSPVAMYFIKTKVFHIPMEYTFGIHV